MGRMKALWKESQTLCETISKETNKAGAVASRFKPNLCTSSLRVTPTAITAFHSHNYIDKQIYVSALKTIKVLWR